MSSRADYLKRYASGGKKAKKAAKKRKREKAPAAAAGGGMRLVESDDEWAAPKAAEWDDDDEAPQVVFDDAEDAVKPEDVVRSRGAWAAVGRSGGGASDSDASLPRRGRAGSDSDASPPRRGRAGSDSDASPPRRGRAGSDSDASPPRRGRAGSDSDASPPRRGRAGSDSDASPPRRGRAGSDSDASPPRRDRAGSDSDASPPRKQRAASDSDASPPRRGRADSDASPPRRPPRTERVAFAPADKKASQQGARHMADGHAAGVLTGAQFKAAETKLRDAKKRDAAAMDPTESGANAATVYRDRRTGKTINLVDEAARIEQERIKKAAEAREQFEWGRGTKQKESEADARKELEAVASEPFARRADDPKLERMRRDVLREGDPMADYIRQGRQVEEEKATPVESRRPVYKGPPAPPNRFGIRPGYRWDGVDRGNGWEAKLQNHAAQKVGLRNDRYAWSCADM